jgi:hypothetical protein
MAARDDLTALPETVDGLIDMLDRHFPLRNFPQQTDLVTLHRHFGARDVVDMLRSLQEERNNVKD